MRKFFVAAACLGMLAIPVCGAKVDAASVPWDANQELDGVVTVGSTVTIPAEDSAIYRLDVTAGQSYYFGAKGMDDARIYDSTTTQNSYSYYYGENYYAVKNETIYLEFINETGWSKGAEEPKQVTIQSGQIFNNTVTKEDGEGDNFYYYTPTLTGEYTFRISSTDAEANPSLNIGTIKRSLLTSLKSKDYRTTYGFGYEEITATLQAGNLYVISAYTGDDYSPYTLALTQKPSVSVPDVTAKKAVSKKVKKAVFTWKKASGVSGYEVTYSLKKNFKKAKTVNVRSSKAKVTLKKLKKGKKYYIRIRAFKTVEGTRYFGAYSKTLKVKVK